GPFWGWDVNGGPEAADNGDGTWTVTFAEAPTAAMEYLWVVDGDKENLIGSDYSCTPVTDNNAYANRRWDLGSGNVTGDNYGTCDAVVDAGGDDSGMVVFPLDFEDAVQDYIWFDIGPDGASDTALVQDPDDAANTSAYSTREGAGEDWNGTYFIVGSSAATPDFSFKMSEDDQVISMRVRSPAVGKAYSLKLEAGPTNSGAVLAKATATKANEWETLYFDFSSPAEGAVSTTVDYAKFIVIFDQNSSDTTDQLFYFDDINYGGLTVPTTDAGGDTSTTTDLTLTVAVPEGTTAVSITGPWWEWGSSGLVGADNGDGTWTVTMTPGSESMEYLWVVDGVQENLIGSDYSCTPVTDNSSYANRRWDLGSGNVTGDNYGTCVAVDGSPADGSSSPAAGELTINGDFEASGDIGWEEVVGDATIANGEAKLSVSASNSVSLIKAANLAAGDIEDGQEFTVKFDLKADVADGSISEKILVQFFYENTGGGSSNGPGILIDNSNPAGLSGWTSYEFDRTVTAAPGGVSLMIKAECGAVSSCGMDLYVDNVSVFAAPIPN
ncbi:MAG: hypothetical protein P8Q91_02335, partial [Porticoccaceae bacterium]|nr:hypothetical protein [Porticoccaceae bacterium]